MMVLLFIMMTLINIFLILWLMSALRTVGEYSAFVVSVGEEIKDYKEHLEAVNEMEIFYGDEYLKSLIEHTKSLKSYLESIEVNERE